MRGSLQRERGRGHIGGSSEGDAEGWRMENEKKKHFAPLSMKLRDEAPASLGAAAC